MIKPFQLLAAAGFLVASASLASAAPASGSAAQLNGGIAAAATSNLIKVHGRHTNCRRSHDGWHRHKRRGHHWYEVRCHPWYGSRRHRYERDCIKIGDFVRICPDN